MMELKYIGRRYEPEYRVLRKHAAYFLLPDGINELKRVSKQKYRPKVLRNIRHDELASDQFAEHQMAVFGIYRTLRDKYGEQLQFFTSTQMASATYFPKQRPDAHIQLGSKSPRLFLLDLLHQDQPFFRATRAIMRYINYADDGDWPSQYAFPKVLFVCDDPALQKRLLKKMKNKIVEAEDSGVKFFITTLVDLKRDVWHDMADPERDVTLGKM